MELKVWVDGIQRVVCGANLSTTCQDVVVALAHAMGRTGRFTLIEKWRDVERPLTPAECPLKSLQKWGEYAAEVRFYLIQAEHLQDKPSQKSPKQRSAQMTESTDDNFSHNSTLPPTSTHSSSSSPSSNKHHPYQNPYQNQPQTQHRQKIAPAPQSIPDSIKRSSTFSGTLNTNYAPMPHSTSLHLKPHQQCSPHGHRQQTQQPVLSHQYNSGHHLPFDSSDKDNSKIASQQYQNIPGAPSSKPSSQSASSNQKRHPLHQKQPNPSLKAQHQHNDESSSPRNFSSNSHSKALSTGHRNKEIISSSSPSQDNRYLQSNNIPRLSQTSSNIQPAGPDRDQQQNRIRSSTSSSPSSSSTSTVTTPRPVPTPRISHSQPRQTPSSSHLPYENLPPVRHSNLNDGTNQLPQTHPSTSSHPPQNQMESTEPKPPSRRRREKVKSTNNDTNKTLESSNTQNRNNENITASDMVQNRGDRLYQKKITDNKSPLFKASNNVPSNFNSDLSDDCFQAPDPTAKTPSANMQIVNRVPNSSHSKDSPPTASINKFTPTPQISQTLPSYSSSSSSPSRSRSLETAGGPRMTKSQTLPSSSAEHPVTPECTRRSDGGGRVNFVESALLRQQQTNGDPDSNQAIRDQFSRRQRREASQDRGRRPSGDNLSGNTIRGDDSIDLTYPPTTLSSQHPGQKEAQNLNSNKYYEETNNTGFTNITSPRSTINDGSFPNFQQQHPYNQNQHHHHPSSQAQHQQQQQSLRTSAFKVVSPRSNRLSSLSSTSHSPQSPISPMPPLSYLDTDQQSPPIAYNLDNQNFDLPVNVDQRLSHHHNIHPSSNFPEFPSTTKASSPLNNNSRPHTRQVSLEIEEYDLDQNFPDISHKDGFFSQHPQPSTLPRRKSHVQSQITEYVMDRPDGPQPSSAIEPEYTRMLRQVKMQQEQLKMLESQVNEMNAEISTLEEEQSNLDLKLDVVCTELSSLEKAENQLETELKEMDRVEWDNVLDGENKCQHDLRSKISKYRVELKSVENKLGELEQEENSTAEALKQEQTRLEEKEKEKEMETMQQLSNTKEDLSALESLLRQREEEMKALEQGIKNMDEKMKSQEEAADQLEKVLTSENLKDFQSNPVPKESSPSSTTSTTTSSIMTTKITTDIDNNIIITKTAACGVDSSLSSSSRPTTPRSRPPSETGEAILKILEDHLSPRGSPSPVTSDDCTTGGLGSANVSSSSAQQNPLKTSTTMVKNPNGVWV